MGETLLPWENFVLRVIFPGAEAQRSQNLTLK